MEYSSGKLYTTFDYWEHVDSTTRAVENVHGLRILGFAFFGAGDTILEGGNTVINNSGGPSRVHPLIVRSTDAGGSWRIAFEDTLRTRGTVRTMSSVLHDTIYAGLTVGFSNLLRSTDNGRSWTYDTVLFMDTNFHPAATWSVSINSAGDAIAAMGFTSTALVQCRSKLAAVETYSGIPYYSYLYPIPASESINVVSEAHSQPIFLFDMLGRKVLAGEVDGAGKGKLDVHSIANGIYILMLQNGDRILPVGRAAIIH